MVDHLEASWTGGQWRGNSFHLKVLGGGELKAEKENPGWPRSPKFLSLCYSPA